MDIPSLTSRYRLHFIFLICLSNLQQLSGSTHWVITSEGRIKPVDFSVFNMQDPSDLVNFLQQEKRVDEERNLRREKEKLYKELTGMARDESQESDLMKTDHDCIAASKFGSMYDNDLYMPIHISLKQLDQSTENLFDPNAGATLAPRPPICSRVPVTDGRKVLQLSELRGIREADKFEDKPEPALRSSVLTSDMDNVDFVGHLINDALLKNDSSWVLYHLATLYWRVNGNSKEALKCLQNAMDTAPKSKIYAALVNLAAILHKNFFHKDAAFVGVIALDHAVDDHSGFIHLLLGNIHCTPAMNELEKCHEHFKRVLTSPDGSINYGDGRGVSLHAAVKPKIHAVSCLHKYKKELEKEQSALDDFIKMQNEFQLLSQLHQEKLKEVNSYRISEEEYYLREKNYQSHINQEYNKLLSYLGSVPSACGDDPDSALQEDGMPRGHCPHGGVPRSVQLSASAVVAGQVQPPSWVVERGPSDLQGDSPPPAVTTTSEPVSPPADASGDSHSPEEKPEARVFKRWSPVVKQRPFKPELGPESCKLHHDAWNEDKIIAAFTSFFVPMPIYNYSLAHVLSFDIEVDALEEHPLPWYPPSCTSPSASEDPTTDGEDFSSALGKRSRRSQSYEPERHLADSFIKLFPVRREAGEHEIGQRLQTAIQKETEPRFDVFNAASLYWRLNGNAHNALDCLSASYNSALDHFKDVALANAVLVLVRAGKSDAAKKYAMMIDQLSPPAHPLVLTAQTLAFAASGLMDEALLTLEAAMGIAHPTTVQELSHPHRLIVCNRRHYQEQQARKAAETTCDPRNGGPEAFPGSGFGECGCSAGGEAVIIRHNDGSCQAFVTTGPGSPTASRQSSPVISRALCGLAPDGSRGCNMFRVEDLGTPRCSHPVLCQPENFFDSAKPTNPGHYRFADIYGKDMDRFDEMHRDAAEIVFFSDRTTAEPLHLVMRVFNEASKCFDMDCISVEKSGVVSGPKLLTVNGGPGAGQASLIQTSHSNVHIHFPYSQPDMPADMNIKNMDGPPVVFRAPNEAVKIKIQLSGVPTAHLESPTTPAALDNINGEIPAPTADECRSWPFTGLGFTSTFILPSAVGVSLHEVIDWTASVEDSSKLPNCADPSVRIPIDMLMGVQKRAFLPLVPEVALRDPWLQLADFKYSFEEMVPKLATALEQNPGSGALANLGALYWRIQGNSSRALDCVRAALIASPEYAKRIAWVSGAAVLHKSGYLQDALHLAYLAYNYKTPLTVSAVAVANIHADLGHLEDALGILQSVQKITNLPLRPIPRSIRTLQCMLMRRQNAV